MSTAASTDGPPLRFRVLGPLEASIDGVPIQLGGGKQQRVIALLLLEANRVVSAERLVDWVWSEEAGDRSPGTLQVYMSNLRRVLAAALPDDAPPLISTQRPGYVIHLEPTQLDLLMFEASRREAEAAMAAGRPGDAAAAYRAALDLWTGEPLAGLPLDPGNGEVTRLGLARLAVMESTAEAELAIGRHREILEDLRVWTRQHPLHEGLRAQLMLSLYRSGQQADALAEFRQIRELLVEELGIDPSRALRDLEDRILRQDPSLDLVAPGTARFDDSAQTVLRRTTEWTPAWLETNDGRFQLERAVTTIGRLADRDLVIADPDVSRHHAEIRRDATRVRVLDSGSANGTYVNGNRVAEHELSHGDVIRVGSAELEFGKLG
jgi:DNA-binding SARP family transcriptional activator